MKKTKIIIGIAGGSGSGKTRLVKNILNEINNNKVISIEVDSYYKDLSHLPFEERSKNNFDHPDAFDFELLYSDLKEILNNKPISTPIYDYKTHTRRKASRKINTNDSIKYKIAIGKTIKDKFDINIFVVNNDINNGIGFGFSSIF